MALRTVLIAAGHNDQTDPGACSADGRLREATLALDLRDLIAANLLARQVPIKTDGAAGTNLPLRDSIAIAKTCDLALEIHFNAGPATAKGVECLSSGEDVALAQQLAFAVATNTKAPLRGVLGWKSPDSGQHHRLGFIADGGGLILEVEFISNPGAMKVYAAQRDAVANSIAQVLAEAAGATARL